MFRGKIVIIDDLKETKYGFEILLNQLEEDPNIIKNKYLKKEESYENSGMLRLDITDITGKEQRAES